jgi:hypothetical protein
MKMRYLLLLTMWIVLAAEFALAAPVVLFDEGHGQPFHAQGQGPLDLSLLAGRFAAAGFDVRVATEPLDRVPLPDAAALVISGAFKPLTADERTAVQGLLARGGSLAVMLHIAPPLAGLLEMLHIGYANGILHDSSRAIDNNPQDFRVSGLARHPLTSGLADFAVHGSWALRATAADIQPLAWSSRNGWVDLERDGQPGPGDVVGPFAVAATGSYGPGRYVVFGDDALFQNRYLAGGNLQLADNLARWMLLAKAPSELEPKLQ